jgi:tetratricopeptide (TPR) repeat protein
LGFLDPPSAECYVRLSDRHFARNHTLSRAGKPLEAVDLRRRDFLIRFSQTTGAALVPARLWGFGPRVFDRPERAAQPAASAGLYLHPHYRSERPLDATLLKVDAALDQFISEKYADQLSAALSEWSASLLQSPHEISAIARSLAPSFSGMSPRPSESRTVRSDAILQIHQNEFSGMANADRDAFLREWQSGFGDFSKIIIAEFQITAINIQGVEASSPPKMIESRVRYEIVGTGSSFHRDQRIGNWQIVWEPSKSGELKIASWRILDETQARSNSPVFVDIGQAAFTGAPSYSSQMLHGADYWRTILDGACGIDVYGHNGVSVADIDNDGFDDLYVCQPAGLPNRLYRNRGDGTFEDITESSGLGIFENTACALFADFNNDGWQDVIIVRTTGPLLFLNDGTGKFHEKPDAFQFANPPQGTFTGAAVADYDRDGWLDIYFCLYAYYQGTGQYKYPTPYHDAENGPPNFLFRNNRDGTFGDVTAPSGLNKNNTRYSFCCGWNDYNADGWPDLYVVNDFGRKNLYQNNGDGIFTDVAAKEDTEDVGAGMSVSWLDYDNDGNDDLYIGNMWTAAGLRISGQNIFKKDSPPEVRALYQKHAMGNSLLHRHGEEFADASAAAGVGMGRWAWSSDAFDFDHDGFADLYVANGMVSGPSRSDLNSFFWRQVVAKSPDAANTSLHYELGWNAINELIRSDGTWSGYERNVFYANNREGTFSDVSAVLGLDFIEDGRSFALADFDHDGRLEVFLKNRNAPQLRLLKNVTQTLPPSISFRLQGKKSNRDAIGAVVTVEAPAGRQKKSVQAGSGFLSQHSKEVFFGLGDAKGTIQASVRWPSGFVQEIKDLPLNHRFWVTEGENPSRVEPFLSAKTQLSEPSTVDEQESLPTTAETWLLSPILAPDFSLADQTGQSRSLAASHGKKVLLNFSSIRAEECQTELAALEKYRSRWSAQSLDLIAIDLSEFAAPIADSNKAPNSSKRETRFSFPVLRASEDVAAIYNILYRQLFDRHRDLRLPTSFLIDADGYIVKVFQGAINPEQIEHDLSRIPRTDAERLKLALPFPSSLHTLEFGRNYLALGSLFYQRGYLNQAEVWLQQALRDDPSSAEALYGIGSVYLNQNKNAAAREAFERCVKLSANYPDTQPDAWNNLGVLDTREGKLAAAVEKFQQALTFNPRHLLSLNNLGSAYRSLRRWDDARKILEQAVSVAPDDAEANYGLGMVYAHANDPAKAYEYLQRALKARPDYPEALNNLGVLYMMTQRPNEAIATFEQCIRVAPAFEQGYLNLARAYAVQGDRPKASGVLGSLLKQHPDDPQAKQMLEQLKK